MKSNLTKQIIYEQVSHLAEKVVTSGIELDENCDYIIIPYFKFPKSWQNVVGIVNGAAPILIDFPDDYPNVPPTGFYIDARVDYSPNGHLYSSTYHGAPSKYTDSGYWKWYCGYINPGGWQPVAYTRPKSWLGGDNLFTFFVLIQEILATKN